MDQALKFKILEFEKALITLENLLEKFDEEDEILRDATIKRFEYSYKLSWKLGKKFLEVNFLEIEHSARSIFIKLRENNLLEINEAEVFLEMKKSRNLTVHTYNLDFVDDLYVDIKIYGKILRQFLEKIKNNKKSQ